MTAREASMSDSEVTDWLGKNLPQWRLEDGWIRRTYKTASWKGTLMVINAVGHLAENHLAIGEVAFLLGFSELSSFYRAFKRWTGTTPAAHREQTRREKR